MKSNPVTRRAFLCSAAASLAAARLHAVPATSFAKKVAHDPQRPQCHFLPTSNWMNDPNGPIFWNGKVHLFYQINPHGADWGDISWGHAGSSDMVHWKHLPVAMEPEAGYPDSFGVFSGSAIADGDRCLAFYTAVERSDAAHATIAGDPQALREQQTVAISTDKDLLKWTKQTQALIPNPPLPNIAGFRDPSVWRDGKTWYMTVGSGQVNGEGMVLLYKATVPTGGDANWEYMHPLISGAGNGKHTPDTVDAGSMWECPDFFELDGHHVLLYSTERKVFWMTGRLNRETMRFEPLKRGVLDTGAYYAPKSMIGPHHERILWGWIPERRPKEQYIAAHWSGAMSYPRVLHVDSEGNLRMAVAPEVDAALLHGPQQASTSEQLRARIAGTAAKISTITNADGSGFTVTSADQPVLSLRQVAKDRVEINGETIQAPLKEGITAYIDASVIEIFFGTRAAHTVRVYPNFTEKSGLLVSALGTQMLVTAQAMKPVSGDRLTK